MAAGIVDRFEIVEIHVEQGVLAAVATRRGDELGESPFEFAPVDQAGQRVMAGLPGQLLCQLFNLADVVKHHDPADQVAGAAVDRRRRIADRAGRTVAPHQLCRNAAAAHALFVAAVVGQSRTRFVVDDAIHHIQRLAMRLGRTPTGIQLGHGVHQIDAAIGTHGDDTVTDRAQCDFSEFLRMAQRVFAADDIAQHELRGNTADQNGKQAGRRDHSVVDAVGAAARQRQQGDCEYERKQTAEAGGQDPLRGKRTLKHPSSLTEYPAYYMGNRPRGSCL